MDKQIVKEYKVGDIVTISNGFDQLEHRKIIGIIDHNGEKRYKLRGIFKYFFADEFE